MSYNKHTWATGNVVGAVDLNRMEQGIEDASGGGGDVGYSCEDGWEELYSYTFPQDTHQSHGSGGYYSTASEQMLLPNRIKVEINSEEYILDGTVGASEIFYGAPTTGGVYPDNYTFDFSEYPFSIENITDSEVGYAINFYTQTNDPCIVTISEAAEIVTTTECFEKARGYSCTDSWQEIWSYEFANLEQVYGHDYYAETASPAIYLPSTIKVEINSEEYTLEGVEYGALGNRYYGAPISFDQYSVPVPDFSGEYQFSITNISDGLLEIKLYVPSDGDYDVTISEYGSYITTTECFKMAVNSVVESTFIVTYDTAHMSAPDKTFVEITEAINAGQIVVLHVGNDNDGWMLFPLVYYDASVVVFTFNEVDLNRSILSHEEYVIDSSDVVAQSGGVFSLTPSV